MQFFMQDMLEHCEALSAACTDQRAKARGLAADLKAGSEGGAGGGAGAGAGAGEGAGGGGGGGGGGGVDQMEVEVAGTQTAEDRINAAQASATRDGSLLDLTAA